MLPVHASAPLEVHSHSAAQTAVSFSRAIDHGAATDPQLPVHFRNWLALRLVPAVAVLIFAAALYSVLGRGKITVFAFLLGTPAIVIHLANVAGNALALRTTSMILAIVYRPADRAAHQQAQPRALSTPLQHSILQGTVLNSGQQRLIPDCEGKHLRRAVEGPLISILLTIVVLAGFSRPVWAHAILMESKPALHSSIKGPDVSVWLRFNVRIDGSRSRVHLVAPDGSQETLPLAKQASPNILESQAGGLKPGAYRLQWQVLASDGHLSRGEVPFTVN